MALAGIDYKAEIKEEEWRRVMDEGRDLARQKMDVMNLAFHNWPHAEGVARRTRGVMETLQSTCPELGITDEDVDVAELGAWWHDVVQNFTKKEYPDGRVMRQRSGDNETRSADELVEWMKEKGVFTEGQMDVVRLGIEATVPRWNQELGTTVQPGLVAELPLGAKAIALADLMEAPESPDQFIESGAALFREDNLVLPRTSEHMVAWLVGQETWVRARGDQFEEEVKRLFPEAAATELLKMKANYEIAAQKAAERAQKAREMTFEELVVEMGYT